RYAAKVCPQTVPAKEARLADEDEVLGVVMEGTARAYAVKTLGAGPDNHIVNDLLHGVPVSVTYCCFSGCAQAFTVPDCKNPLEIEVGGFSEHNMLLRVGEDLYYQGSLDPFVVGADLGQDLEVFPYRLLPFTKTTWKKWKDLHPATDVYVRDQ